MTEEEEDGYSIVEHFSDHSGYRCGYCKSKDTNYSHGMWAHKMSVQDYQNLIDRGWRRSGKYCYKPTMDKTCCPQYTIKCDALNFRLSKSQKKVLKRVHAYLSYGKRQNSAGNCEGDNTVGTHESDLIQPKCTVNSDLSDVQVSFDGRKQQRGGTKVRFRASSKKLCSENFQSEKEDFPEGRASPAAAAAAAQETRKKKVKPGIGQDLSKPPCKKAKLLRKERWASKLASFNSEVKAEGKKADKSESSNQPKSLEEYLNAPLPDSPLHRLEIRLVTALPIDHDYRTTLDTSHSVYKKYQMTIHKEPESTCSRSRYEGFLCNSSLQFRLVPVSSREPKFTTTIKLSYGVFRDYQMVVHHDPPDECDEASFKNFLVDGAFTPWKPPHGPPRGYGPFHQQYWLDGQMIAVGVLDILPCCVSSVYLYYDPKFSFLSLGTYSSLREIALTRELNRSSPSLRWYYMGFYIHSCPKMRYKGNYAPSFLLCPESYSWVPLQKCAPKLDVNKYSRFSEDTQPPEEAMHISRVRCLYNGFITSYGALQRSFAREDDEDEVKEYLSLVGAKAAATSLLLYRA